MIQLVQSNDYIEIFVFKTGPQNLVSCRWVSMMTCFTRNFRHCKSFYRNAHRAPEGQGYQTKALRCVWLGKLRARVLEAMMGKDRVFSDLAFSFKICAEGQRHRLTWFHLGDDVYERH